MRSWVELGKEPLNDGQTFSAGSFKSVPRGRDGDGYGKCAVDGADGGEFIGESLTQINFRQGIAPRQRQGSPA